MRKDYMQVAGDSAVDETDFVEAHWTKIWEQEGGPSGRIDKIPRQDEYRHMVPHLADLPLPARILDGGCGTGEWVLALRRKGFDVVGLDLSRKTVAQLNELFPNAEFVAGDVRDTGFSDQSFDAYYSWGVFEHFEAGPLACLSEAFRILKPGGLLFASTPLDNLRHSLKGAFARPVEGVAPDKTRFYQYRFTRAEWAHEVSRAGFEIVAMHPIHKRQGVLRSLHHTLGMPYPWLLTRGMAAGLAYLAPASWFAHMNLVVARKPLRAAAVADAPPVSGFGVAVEAAAGTTT